MEPAAVIQASIGEDTAITDLCGLVANAFPMTAAKSGNRLVVSVNNESGWNGSGHHTGNVVSVLDLDDARWQDYERSSDFGGGEPLSLIAERDEIVVLSDRGAHRFQVEAKSWRRLDPQNESQAQEFGDVALVGDELWVGYDGYERQELAATASKPADGPTGDQRSCTRRVRLEN